jgi:hypothetical protein
MNSLILDDFTSTYPLDWEGHLERGTGTFPDERPSGAIKGMIGTCELPGDWNGCGSLQFTLYNPTDRVMIGGIEIYDQTALDSPELIYEDYIKRARSLLIGEGVTHVVIRIDPILTNQGTRMLDLGNVRKLALRVPEPGEGEKPVSIALLRLSGEHDEIDSLSSARPGDSVLIMKHLDISCFTYQPENYREPDDIAALFAELESERSRLQDAICTAEINGKQTLYSRRP